MNIRPLKGKKSVRVVRFQGINCKRVEIVLVWKSYVKEGRGESK
jgi:hypothetical protein